MECSSAIPGVRVKVVDEADATGATGELYERIRDVTGLPFVPDVFRLVSTRPDLLNAVVAGHTALFSGGLLARDTKELISAWTSKLNNCSYCVDAHSWFLRRYGGGDELIDAVTSAATPEGLPADERTKALLRLATKVTAAAHEITDADWEEARECGWSDAELLEATFCAALFGFVNRLVGALGLGERRIGPISRGATKSSSA